ncbi:MAG: hypothetical protein ACOYO1_01000 [Bacteroidales bacterium]
MRFCIIIFIIFLAKITSSQSILTFSCDTDYVEYNIDLLKLREKKIDLNPDFELRLWIKNSICLPKKISLINIIYKDNKWNVKSYKFLFNGERKIRTFCKRIKNVDTDSLFSYMLFNNINSIPRQGELNYRAFEQKDEIIVMDGVTYRIELIKPNCQRWYEYHSPKIYSEHYDFVEYKNVVNIITRLLLLTGDYSGS